MPWLTGYTRRKSKGIVVSSAGAQTNYQMKITIYKQGLGPDSPTQIYLGGHCKDDFTDIRFTLNDQVTLLNYWIESYISGNYAVVWIKVPAVPPPIGVSVIYIYYDNPLASITGQGTGNDDGVATFQLFDHFLGTTLDTSKWNTTPCNRYSISGSNLTTISQTCLSVSLEVLSSATFGNFTAFRTRLSLPWGSCPASTSWNNCEFGYEGPSGEGNNGTVIIRGNGNWICNSLMNFASGWASAGISGDSSTHIWEIQRTNTSSNAYKDDSLVAGPLSSQYPTISGNVGFTIQQSGSGNIVVDWALVRNYVNPEPTFGTSGIEELDITATYINLSNNTCLGQCSIGVGVTWQNYGNNGITFRPAVLIDNITIAYATSDLTISAGSTGNALINTPTLSVGIHTICPYPN